MELLLVRHAQTHANVAGALDTGLPGADLTELGEQQVRELTALLSGERIDAIWCSPALRTRRTAAGLAQERGLDLRIRAGLVEIAAGDWEMSTDEQHAAHYREAIMVWLAGDPAAQVPGGETGEEFLARFDAVVEEIQESGLASVAVVSHGAILRAWCGARVGNVPLALVREHPLRNTGVARLRSDGAGWLATSWDDQVVAVGGAAGPSAEPA